MNEPDWMTVNCSCGKPDLLGTHSTTGPCHVDAVNISQERVDEMAKSEHEPVAWMYVNTDGECEQIEYGEPFDDPSVTPLYTAPPSIEAAVLAEREACAKVCDDFAAKDKFSNYYAVAARAIRKRGEK